MNITITNLYNLAADIDEAVSYWTMRVEQEAENLEKEKQEFIHSQKFLFFFKMKPEDAAYAWDNTVEFCLPKKYFSTSYHTLERVKYRLSQALEIRDTVDSLINKDPTTKIELTDTEYWIISRKIT